MPYPVNISAPSRLHFGLFSVGNQIERRFGGIGLMVADPRTRIEVSPAQKFLIEAANETCPPKILEPIMTAAESWFQFYQKAIQEQIGLVLSGVQELPLKIVVHELPPRHAGLGSGTQIALSIATALNKYHSLPVPSPEELAKSIGRGRRSAIGTYGFFNGGLLVDRGKIANDDLAPLDFQTSFPLDWPIVLIRPVGEVGLSGESELDAFGQLPDVSEKKRDEMVELVREGIIPGVMNRNYQQFSESIFKFGFNSGMFYESIQGGAYNGKVVTELVKSIREFGVPATGQTSWGPTVFAIAKDGYQATELMKHLSETYGNDISAVQTVANNQGARVNA